MRAGQENAGPTGAEQKGSEDPVGTVAEVDALAEWLAGFDDPMPDRVTLERVKSAVRARLVGGDAVDRMDAAGAIGRCKRVVRGRLASRVSEQSFPLGPRSAGGDSAVARVLAPLLAMAAAIALTGSVLWSGQDVVIPGDSELAVFVDVLSAGEDTTLAAISTLEDEIDALNREYFDVGLFGASDDEWAAEDGGLDQGAWP